MNFLRPRNTRAPWLVCGVAVLLPLGCATQPVPAQADTVKIVKKANGGFQLLRNGQPYFIKGAGGDGSKAELKADGGNSWRTWGVGNDTQGQLDQAQKLGMTVTVGIWLGHTDNGFHWDDAGAGRGAEGRRPPGHFAVPQLPCPALLGIRQRNGNRR